MIYALIVVFMVTGSVILWQAIQTFERRGTVFVGLGFVRRDRSPRWYRFHISMWRLVFVLSVIVTLMASFLFMAAGTNA